MIDLDQHWVKQYIGEPGHPAQVISQVLGDLDGVIITLQSPGQVKLSFDENLLSLEQIELILEQKLIPQFRLGPGELNEVMHLAVSDRKPSGEPIKPQHEEPPQAQQSQAEETERKKSRKRNSPGNRLLRLRSLLGRPNPTEGRNVLIRSVRPNLSRSASVRRFRRSTS
jgi:hypothetical protein